MKQIHLDIIEMAACLAASQLTNTTAAHSAVSTCLRSLVHDDALWEQVTETARTMSA